MYTRFPLPRGYIPQLPRHCSWCRILLLIWLLVILWNEYLVFVVQPLRWSVLKQNTLQDAVVVLFVADPQMIGLHDEPKRIGPISRWDSDRFLQKTFNLAYQHAKPDVIVFLGDLLDEGSQASSEDYKSYMERFHYVFNIPSHVKTVYLPGDNDVGGEGLDRKEPYKVAAFYQHFLPDQVPPKDVVNVKYLDFLRLDLAPNEVAASRIQHNLSNMRRQSTASYRILCSHVTIIDRSSNDQNEIISLSGAHVIFSAHTHQSNIIICNDCTGSETQNRKWKNFQGTTIPVYDNRIYHMNMNDRDQMYEFQVPTCSYRMGVPKMGYGLASFSSDGTVKYTVLWSPQRYSQLFMYVVLLAGTVIGFVLVVSYIVLWPTCRTIHHYVHPYCKAHSPLTLASVIIFISRLRSKYYYHLYLPTASMFAKMFKHRPPRLKSMNAMV